MGFERRGLSGQVYGGQKKPLAAKIAKNRRKGRTEKLRIAYAREKRFLHLRSARLWNDN